MVLHSSWDAFERAATEIFAGAPDRARYTLKYRNCDAALVLKVTDDATCIQLRTGKLDDIRRIARLHQALARGASDRAAVIKNLLPIFPKRETADAPITKAKSGSGVAKKQQRQPGQ
ncbi:hypothetical protein LPJ61_002624, partial [Coemansia biformis]